jgi:transposase InsO family protein
VTVYPFIEAEKAAERNVRRACALLKVSRAAYYTWRTREPSARERDDAALAGRLRTIHQASRGTYGSPRIHAQLKREGRRCSRKRVARLMAKEGLLGRQRRQTKRTTLADTAVERPPDLLQRRFATASLEPNRVWVGDISYLRT